MCVGAEAGRLHRSTGSEGARAAQPRPTVAPEWKALLSREPLHFEHTVQDEAAGLPWAKAKIQVLTS